MKKVGQIYREKIVENIKDGFSKSNNVFLMSYTNLSGDEINGLRKTLSVAGAGMTASKNKLAKVVLNDLNAPNLLGKIEKQTAFVWGPEDAGAVAKLLMEYSEEKENVNITGGVFDGVEVSVSDVKKLSELPSREVLLSMLLATIQAPLTRLAGALTGKHKDLLSILKQLSEKKGEK